MSNQKSPYMDMIINLVTNPWVLAAAGGIAGHYGGIAALTGARFPVLQWANRARLSQLR